MENEKDFLLKAIEMAQKSVSKGGFPAGALIIKGNEIIGSGISVGNLLHDPTSHSEVAAIRDACKNLKSTDLSGAVLYASMQPCLMCFGASMWSQVSKIVFACSKEVISEEYYGGHYRVEKINDNLSRQIEIVHLPELQKQSLAVVKDWEKSLKSNIST